jgi:anchored repeat ABC transporter substrate-binding protein
VSASRSVFWVVVVIAVTGFVPACAPVDGPSVSDGRIQVVTTTAILRDLVEHVGRERVRVTSLVPAGADVHLHEPSIRSLRDVADADLAFSNYRLYEPPAVIGTLESNLPAGAEHISLAEEAVAHAGEIIQLVEDPRLDALWLGLGVHGADDDLDRSSRILLSGTALDGPGRLVAYVTGSFGRPQIVIDSGDGFDAGNGFRDDTAELPPAAHSHMTWAFTAAGVYRLELRAASAASPTSRPREIDLTTVTFAVGVDPHEVSGMDGATVIAAGHADITVELGHDGIVVLHDRDDGRPPAHHDPARTVIHVPNRTLQEVPADPSFRFLGRPGQAVHLLPQAVLGRHVHGEIDPHLWHDIDNAVAYVNIVRDALVRADPTGAATYRANAAAYVEELAALDEELDVLLAEVPPRHRHLVTTHDSFRYLAQDRGFDVAGVVTAGPATDPSMADRRRLTETVRNLGVPAVFVEPNSVGRPSVLADIAAAEGAQVCPLRSDTLDDEAPTYVELMRTNARNLRRCLST